MKIILKSMLAAAACASLLSSGPAGAADEADVLIVNGKDRLTLSSSAAVNYQRYFEHACPMVLAAHESGRWVSATTGPDENCATGTVDFRRYIRATLAACEGGVRYGECWVVALGREIVWEGPIRSRTGKWTPKSDRQFSVTLEGEATSAAGVRTVMSTVGLATYRKDGKTADIAFDSRKSLGHCKGELRLADAGPSPFTVRCGKVGDVSGLFDANPDGRTGTGAGSGKNARHFELMVLPHQQYVAKK